MGSLGGWVVIIDECWLFMLLWVLLVNWFSDRVLLFWERVDIERWLVVVMFCRVEGGGDGVGVGFFCGFSLIFFNILVMLFIIVLEFFKGVFVNIFNMFLLIFLNVWRFDFGWGRCLLFFFINFFKFLFLVKFWCW